MQKCFKHSHALMLKQNLGRVTEKTEPTEKVGKLNRWKIHISSFPSVDGNEISALAIIKTLKNGCHVININRTEKFQITDPPKVWVSGFPSVDRNGISSENWRCKFSFF